MISIHKTEISFKTLEDLQKKKKKKRRKRGLGVPKEAQTSSSQFLNLVGSGSAVFH